MADTFSPHYHLGEEIGRGAYSVVHLGVKRATGEKVAVKVFVRSKLTPKDMEQLQGEVRVLKVLDHPHVIRMHDFCMDAANFYIVTEFLEGGELFDSIVERERYSERDAQTVLRALAEALDYCHSKSVVHRDLKPENILLANQQDLNIKLADFGFAKELTDEELLHTALGTPGYIAPEILNRKPYDSAVDMWSFGVIAYVLLCGYPPFYDADGNQARLFEQIRNARYEFDETYWSKVSEPAKNLIAHLLVVDPAKRLTAKQVLSHPWIVSDLPARDITPAIEMLRSQMMQRRLRAGVKGVMALERMRKLAGGGGVLPPGGAGGAAANTSVVGMELDQ